jgi:DNA-binding MarR family transcriptional regulator
VQQYSHYIWELTEKTATQDILDRALERLLDVNSALYQYETENLSNTQLALLLALKNGETSLTSIETQKRYPIGTPSNIAKNIKILEKKDFIERTNKKIEFIDPVFELWFQKYFS